MVVQGYQIEWTRTPFQVYLAITSVTSKEAALLIEGEVDSLIQRGAVVVVPPYKPVYQLAFPIVEKDFKTCDQLKAIEHFYLKRTLQDGGCQHDQGPIAIRRLNVLFGSQGCLLCSPNC